MKCLLIFCFALFQHRVKPGWNKRSGSTNRLNKEQQIVFVHTTADNKTKTCNKSPIASNRRENPPSCDNDPPTSSESKVGVDSGSNLGYIPYLFGGTAALVPPYPVHGEGVGRFVKKIEFLHVCVFLSFVWKQ